MSDDKRMINITKYVPLWKTHAVLGGLGFLGIAWAKVGYNPEVIQSKAILAEKSAVVWEASQPFADNLPSILTTGAYAILSILVWFGVFILLIALSVSIVSGSVSNVARSGLGVYKESPDWTNTFLVAQPAGGFPSWNHNNHKSAAAGDGAPIKPAKAVRGSVLTKLPKGRSSSASSRKS